MNPLDDPEDLDEATRLINSYAQSDWCDISYARHGRDRLQQRAISNPLMMAVLKEGVVDDVRQDVFNGRIRYAYRIRVLDQWGHITVITAVPGYHRLHIISSFTDIPD